MVTSCADILEELKIEQITKPRVQTAPIKLSGDEEKVHSVLSHESVHIDRIGKLTKLETATVSGVLAILEIKGLIKNIGGQNYIRL
jgi:DNA processing protein